MTDLLNVDGSLQQARQMFFQHGLDPAPHVAPHISRSWQRSHSSEISPAEPISSVQLGERREQALRLLDCAQSELDGLTEQAADQGCVVILSDADGLILQEMGGLDFLSRAAQFALKPGVAWSEHCVGTNAIGTALIERDALMVLGAEHYLAGNAPLGCAAAPIFDGRGGVAGVVDISGEAGRITWDTLGLVRMAAWQIEHRMVLAGAQGHLLRFHAKPSLIGTPREGLVVIADGRIVAANRFALGMFGTDWSAVLHGSAERLLGCRWARIECQHGLLSLPGGRRVPAKLERIANPPLIAPQGAAAATTPKPPAPPVDDVQPLLDRALRVIEAGVSVLIRGETGTGKDVFARRLHAAGKRRSGPFVALDCASLPEPLIESELFGYEDGAFTGARRRGMPGRIREANGGTLFLDEVAEMPIGLQSRLLRVLEDRVVVPLGGGRGVSVDFDLICATHQNLATLTQTGRFRVDLMYRVAGFSVALPALRERADRHSLILQIFAEQGGRAKSLRFDDDVLDRLMTYPWPGNLRELRSVLKSTIALAEPGAVIRLCDVSGALLSASAASPTSRPDVPTPATLVGLSLKDAKRYAIDEALAACGYSVADAAGRLGVHRSTVYRELRRLRGKSSGSGSLASVHSGGVS